MADFKSKIKVSFIDDFSQGAAAAQAQLKGLSGAAGGFSAAGKKMQRTGMALSTGVTAPLVAVGVAAVKSGEALNRGMANVQSLGIAQERVEELKKGVQAAAIAVGGSTSDMSEGLYQVISAMGDSEETVSILELNAKAAAAGIASTTDAINLSSAVMKGYGDVSLEANKKVSDLALQTVKLGQTTFPELAASIGKVTPLASAMNVSQEELFATMATLTGVTGGAAEVTTQMRGAVQAFMAPSAAMKGLISKLGYESGAAMIQQEGFHGAIIEMVSAAKQSGAPLQSYIGSIEGQTLALSMAGEQSDTYAAKLSEMVGVSGVTDEAFAAQTQGINESGFAFQQMRSQLQVTLQELSVGLTPAITAALDAARPFVEKIGELATRFAELEPKQQANIMKIFGLVAVAGPALVVLGGLSRGVGGIISGVGKVIPLLGGLQTVLFGTTTAAGITTPGLFGLAAANWAVLWPILAIIAAIVALILIIRHFRKKKKDLDMKDAGLTNGMNIPKVGGVGNASSVPPGAAGAAAGKGTFQADSGYQYMQNMPPSNANGEASSVPPGAAGAATGTGTFQADPGYQYMQNMPPSNANGEASIVQLGAASAAGVQAPIPGTENGGFQTASDYQYVPHSNAKNGGFQAPSDYQYMPPPSALGNTPDQGAGRARPRLSGASDLSAPRTDGTNQTTYSIRIDNLNVQADDAEDIFRFVRMLKAAGGAA